MFETVTPGISGHTAQAEPTAAAIAKRFSAMTRFCSLHPYVAGTQ